MKRLSILVILAFAIILIGCSEDDNPVSGPTLSAPINLTATALSDNQVQLTWLDSCTIETGFLIQKSESDSGSWVTVGETAINITDFRVTGLDEGTEYKYRVQTLGFESTSDPSEVASVTTLAFPPSNLIALQDLVTFIKITLTWTDLSTKETGYQIQRKLGSNDLYEFLVELDADVEEYIDESLDSNTTYDYQVRAMIDTVGSMWSDDASANTTILTPPSPTNLTASNQYYPAQTSFYVTLTWNDRPNNLGYIIERSFPEDENWEVIDTLEIENLGDYTDFGLSGNTTYYYRITAYNIYGNSPYSNVASTTTPFGPPNAPTNLRLESATFEVVNLAWDDNSNDETGNETGFQLQRKAGNEPRFVDYALIAQNLSVFADTNVVMESEYQYRVKAVNALSSRYSNELTVNTPDGPPYPPTFTMVETRSTSEIFLSWTPHPRLNHDGYYLERKSEHDTVFTQVGGELYQTSYNDTGLDMDTWFTYRLYSFNEAAGRSDFSETDSAQTWTTVVLSEGFEDYTDGEMPPAPWEVFERGGSRTTVSSADHHDGAMSLQILDTNPIPTDSATTSAVIRTRQVAEGTIEFWMKIANNGYLGMDGGDPNNIYTFRLQFSPDNLLIYFHRGVPLGIEDCFPTDEWFKFTIVFDAIGQSFSLLVNDEEKLTTGVLQRADHGGNSVFVMYTFIGATLSYCYFDDLEINDTSASSVMQTWGSSSTGVNGTIRVNDIQSVIGPVR